MPLFSSRSDKRAFTLLELIVVIVILGVLAAIAIPTFSRVIENSQDASTATTVEAMLRDSQALYAFGDTSWEDAVRTAAAETQVSASSLGVLAAGVYTPIPFASADPEADEVVFLVSGDTLVLAALSPSSAVCIGAATDPTLTSAECVLPAEAAKESDASSALGAALKGDVLELPARVTGSPVVTPAPTPTATPTPTPSYADVVKADSPLAYYRLDDPSGSVLADSSGNRLSGAVTGSVITGVPGASARTGTGMNVSGGELTLSTGRTSGSLSVQTVEFWMRSGNFATAGVPVSVGPLYSLWANNGNIGFNTGAGDLYGVSTASLTNGVWYHVVAEFHAGSISSNKLWINGVAQTLETKQAPPRLSSATLTSTLQISSLPGYAQYRFAGDIDDVSIYAGSLTSAQVLAHYDAAK